MMGRGVSASSSSLCYDTPVATGLHGLFQTYQKTCKRNTEELLWLHVKTLYGIFSSDFDWRSAVGINLQDLGY